MSDNLACAREQAAVDWLAGYDPQDDYGGGIGPERAVDPEMTFTQPVVIDAFVAGMGQAEAEFAVERADGQRQLDDATSLMREAAGLFKFYESEHRDKAATARDELGYSTCQTGRAELMDLIASRESKADRNALMASRLEAWLRGDRLYPVTTDGAYAAHAGHAKPEPNLRAVSSGPLADPVVVEGLMAASGLIDATRPADALSVVKEGAFRLQTGDPRFDPERPVLVNGFLYRPATEA